MHRTARIIALAAATPVMVHALEPYSAATLATINQATNLQFNRSDITNPTSALTAGGLGYGAIGRNSVTNANARLFWQAGTFRVSDLMSAIGSANPADLANFTFTYRGVTEGSTADIEDTSEFHAAYLGQWEDSGASFTDVPLRGAGAQNMGDTTNGAADAQRTLFGTAIETLSGYSPAQPARQIVDLNFTDLASTAQTLSGTGFNLSHLAIDLAADSDLTNNHLFFSFYVNPKLAATTTAINQLFTSLTLIPVEIAAKTIDSGIYDVAGPDRTDAWGFGAGLTQTGGTIRFEIDGSGPDQLFVTGDYTQSAGDISIGLIGAPAIGSAVPLLYYSGALSGTPAITLEPTTRFTLAASSLGDGSDDVVTATFAGSAASLYWVGGNGSAWDLNLTQNWLNGAAPDNFFNVDAVTFDDLATTFTPSVTGTLYPGAVTFENDTQNYTLGGSGKIAGGATLSHTGSGEVLILGNHSYTGATSVTDSLGVLRVGNGGSTGSLGSGSISVNGELAFNRSDEVTVPNAVTGSAGLFVQDGSGALVITGTHGGSMAYDVNAGSLRVGNGTAKGALTPLASVLVNAPGSLVYDRSDSVTLDAALEGTGTVIYEGSGLVNQSAYTISGNSGTFAGPVVVDQSRIAVDNYTVDLGGATGVTVGTGGTLWLSAAGTFSYPVSLSGNGWLETGGPFGAVRLQSGADLAGPITLAGNTRIGTVGSTGVISGVITETGGSRSLELYNGSSTLNAAITVSGNNEHSGGTTVRGVVATILNITSFGTGPVAIEAHPTSTARFSGVLLDAVTVGNDFTVAADSFLSGTGGSTGTVTLNGGILAPGDTFPGTLAAATVNATAGILDIRIDSSLQTGDSLSSGGVVTLGAGMELAVTDVATTPVALPDGVKFTLIDHSGGSLAGTFNGLAEAGTLTVGPNTFAIGYDDAGKVTLTTVSPDPYAAWAAAEGLDGSPGKEAGFDDDAEKDGVANGLEWILGGDPLAGGDSAPVAITGSAATGLTLVFDRIPDSIGEASLFVDWGVGLAPFGQSLAIGTSDVGPAGNAPTIDLDAPAPGQVTVNIPAANATGGALFARLRATQP